MLTASMAMGGRWFHKFLELKKVYLLEQLHLCLKTLLLQPGIIPQLFQGLILTTATIGVRILLLALERTIHQLSVDVNHPIGLVIHVRREPQPFIPTPSLVNNKVHHDPFVNGKHPPHNPPWSRHITPLIMTFVFPWILPLYVRIPPPFLLRQIMQTSLTQVVSVM
ncbi:unnamed protein product [Echinostoma caproni]|uniref:Ovule protein n=1 Tax=Echinostoma caproni TaxID=27848 RepID=A0A183B3A8_9TREM|nr:unnamed protein product [Echinostoma caproni]